MARQETEAVFDCPYCKTAVRSGDRHAATIEKKNIKDRATITVKCELVRTFEIEPKEVEG